MPWVLIIRSELEIVLVKLFKREQRAEDWYWEFISQADSEGSDLEQIEADNGYEYEIWEV